jgi:DNA replicative helicase MCM subunit Mcm2 (Cdc46/Mcm family)
VLHSNKNNIFGGNLGEVLNIKLGFESFTTALHNKNVSLSGVVNRVKVVTPELINATFCCERCGEIVSLSQGGGKCKLLPPEFCINKNCTSKKPRFKFLEDKSTFQDYQEVWIKPIDKPMIKLGRGQKIILKKELVGVKEGQNVQVVGKLGFELKGRTTFADPVVMASKITQLD